MKKQFKILVLITGLLVVGEAAALILGMVLLSSQPNPWLTLTNGFFLLTDLLLGFQLLSVYGKRNNIPGTGFIITVFFLLLTHGYRDVEIFFNLSTSPFLVNIPLMIVNNIKLLGLVLVLVFYKPGLES